MLTPLSTLERRSREEKSQPRTSTLASVMLPPLASWLNCARVSAGGATAGFGGDLQQGPKAAAGFSGSFRATLTCTRACAALAAPI